MAAPSVDTGQVPARGRYFNPENPGEELEKPKIIGDMTPQDLLHILLGYLHEAREGRSGGYEDRETTWRNNSDAYWARYEYSDKAEWQAREVMPQVNNSVERFGSAMRTALKSAGEWHEPKDPADPTGILTPVIRRILDFYFERSGSNSTGHTVGFDHTFGDLMKGGALKANCASVTWDHVGRRVKIEAVDPSEVYLDPTGRNLYRIRERKVDLHELQKLAGVKDSSGNAVYNAAAIERLRRTAGSRASTDDIDNDKDRMSGGTKEISSARRPIRIHEFLCNIIDANGELVAENQLVVMADEREIIRGPEKNPFWHGKDWIVFSPMISVPWTVYGRSYVESFVQLAGTFNELTNMMLDAVRTTSNNAFMVWVEALLNPAELNDGVHPNKTFQADPDWPVDQDFIRPVQMGNLTRDAFLLWEGIKDQLMEAASENEISLGQLAPKSGTTAFEIGSATQGGQQIVANIAADVEATLLSPIAELTWMTALQHMEPERDPELRAMLGPWAGAITFRKKEFRKAGFQIKVAGISGLLKRAETARALLGFLNVIGSNPLLTQAFQQRYSLNKVIQQLLKGAGVDVSSLELEPGEVPVEQPLPGPGAQPGDLVDSDPEPPVQGA